MSIEFPAVAQSEKIAKKNAHPKILSGHSRIYAGFISLGDGSANVNVFSFVRRRAPLGMGFGHEFAGY